MRVLVFVVIVFVVLVFDESKRPLLGLVLPLVLTQHRAVWGAEMAHLTKLPDSSPDEQLFPLGCQTTGAVPDHRKRISRH